MPARSLKVVRGFKAPLFELSHSSADLTTLCFVGIKSPFDPEYADFGSVHTTYDVLIPFSETYVASLNVTTVAELRALTLAELQLGTGTDTFTAPWYAVVDGWAVPYTYLGSLLHGPANDVPVLVGNNRDEDGVDLETTYTVAEYLEAIDTRYNATFAAEFLKLYPSGSTNGSATLAYNAQVRDQVRISTWEWASLYEKKATSNVYTVSAPAVHTCYQDADVCL